MLSSPLDPGGEYFLSRKRALSLTHLNNYAGGNKALLFPKLRQCEEAEQHGLLNTYVPKQRRSSKPRRRDVVAREQDAFRNEAAAAAEVVKQTPARLNQTHLLPHSKTPAFDLKVLPGSFKECTEQH